MNDRVYLQAAQYPFQSNKRYGRKGDGDYEGKPSPYPHLRFRKAISSASIYSFCQAAVPPSQI